MKRLVTVAPPREGDGVPVQMTWETCFLCDGEAIYLPAWGPTCSEFVAIPCTHNLATMGLLP